MEGITFSFNTFQITLRLLIDFQLSCFSNDSSFIRWENGERLRLHPDFNLHPFGHCVIFSGKKSRLPSPPHKSEGACTPMLCVQKTCSYHPKAACYAQLEHSVFPAGVNASLKMKDFIKYQQHLALIKLIGDTIRTITYVVLTSMNGDLSIIFIIIQLKGLP